MGDVHQNSLRASLSSIFKSGKYSDMVICSRSREFKVHQAIICPRSRVFAAAIDGGFQESVTKKISLDDDDPDTVERMLSYLYTFDYDDGGSPYPAEAAPCSKELMAEELMAEESMADELETDEGEFEIPEALLESPKHRGTPAIVGVSEGALVAKGLGLLNNALVYAIADKYCIFELKELAKTKFLSRADGLIPVHEFPEIIRVVYQSTPNSDRELRNAVLGICVKQLRTLMNNIAFNDVVRDVAGFGFDILCQSVKYDDERLDQTLAQKTALEEEMVNVRAEILHAKLNENQAREILKGVVRVVNNYTSCRHCGVDFLCHVEEDDPAQLRCVKCRTRHR